MLKKNYYILPILLISLIIFNIQVNRIYPFEFDTSVYFTLLDSLIRTGKAMMPIVAGGLPNICDIDLNCSFSHPNIYGQQLFTQMPPDYTSGISLLFIPLLIHKILTFFNNLNLSLAYFIEIYFASACLLYFLSASLVIKFSQIKSVEKLIYIVLSFISQILIIQYASNAIIGELYASIIISNVGIGTAIILTKNQSSFFYYLCATLLGIAIESKISSIFPACAIFSIIILKCYIEKKSFFNFIILIILFSLTKIISIFYYFNIFNFSIDNIILYFKSISAVYSYNANAGMGWGNTGIIKQLHMIFLNPNINLIIFTGIICYIISLVYGIKIKNRNAILTHYFIIYILAASLIYPIIFKFPYTRILSPFFGLLPLVFLPSLKYIIELRIKNYRKAIILFITLASLIFYAYQISPPHYPLIENIRTQEIESFENSYPNFKFKKSDIFVASHFFGMPWDIYLSASLDNKGPLNSHTIYGYQSLEHNIINLGDTYLLQSCRWGHCNKETEINGIIPSFRGSRATIKCTLIPRDSKAIYKLYKCNIKNIIK